MSGHIVPMGAGRAVMDRRFDPLHDYVLELTGKDDPVVLFLPTATGDDAAYIVSFYEAFHSGRCSRAGAPVGCAGSKAAPLTRSGRRSGSCTRGSA